LLISFRKRNKESLGFRVVNNLSKQRAGCLTPKTLAEFFNTIKENLTALGLEKKPGSIFNCDETSFSASYKPRKVFCDRKVNSVNKKCPNNEKQTYTVQVKLLYFPFCLTLT
jgi:hypothetical protein